MWKYEKLLQYPVNIKNTNPALAKVIITQLGGGECKDDICIGQMQMSSLSPLCLPGDNIVAAGKAQLVAVAHYKPSVGKAVIDGEGGAILHAG